MPCKKTCTCTCSLVRSHTPSPHAVTHKCAGYHGHGGLPSEEQKVQAPCPAPQSRETAPGNKFSQGLTLKNNKPQSWHTGETETALEDLVHKLTQSMPQQRWQLDKRRVTWGASPTRGNWRCVLGAGVESRLQGQAVCVQCDGQTLCCGPHILSSSSLNLLLRQLLTGAPCDGWENRENECWLHGTWLQHLFTPWKWGVCMSLKVKRENTWCVCVHAKSLQSYLTLYNPMDCCLPDSSVHRSLQTRILEWVTMPFSKGSSWPRDRTRVSCLLHWQVGSLPLVPPVKPRTPDCCSVAKLCLTLCDPMDCSTPGFPVLHHPLENTC